MFGEVAVAQQRRQQVSRTRRCTKFFQVTLLLVIRFAPSSNQALTTGFRGAHNKTLFVQEILLLLYGCVHIFLGASRSLKSTNAASGCK